MHVKETIPRSINQEDSTQSIVAICKKGTTDVNFKDRRISLELRNSNDFNQDNYDPKATYQPGNLMETLKLTKMPSFTQISSYLPQRSTSRLALFRLILGHYKAIPILESLIVFTKSYQWISKSLSPLQSDNPQSQRYLQQCFPLKPDDPKSEL